MLQWCNLCWHSLICDEVCRLDEPLRPGLCQVVPLAVGQAFELNNLLVHAVRNEGPEDRLHLVLDVAEQPAAERLKLRAGQTCLYAKNQIVC